MKKILLGLFLAVFLLLGLTVPALANTTLPARGRTAEVIVAPSNATVLDQQSADYVLPGTNDGTYIDQTILPTIATTGCKLHFDAGTVNLDQSINDTATVNPWLNAGINNLVIEGSGDSTIFHVNTNTSYNTTLTANVLSAASSVTVASSTGYSLGEQIFIGKTGTATGGTTTTLVDTTWNFGTTGLVGQHLYVWVAGVQQVGTITASSGNTITCSGGFSGSVTPVNTDPYELPHETNRISSINGTTIGLEYTTYQSYVSGEAFYPDYNAIEAYGVSGCQFNDFYINGNYSGQTYWSDEGVASNSRDPGGITYFLQQNGVFLNNCSNCFVNFVHTKYIAGWGGVTFFNGCANCTASNCIVEHSVRHGYVMYYNDINCIWQDNVGNANGDGITLQPILIAQVHNYIIENCPAGLDSLQSCTSENSYQDGYYYYWSSWITMTGCKSYNDVYCLDFPSGSNQSLNDVNITGLYDVGGLCFISPSTGGTENNISISSSQFIATTTNNYPVNCMFEINTNGGSAFDVSIVSSTFDGTAVTSTTGTVLSTALYLRGASGAIEGTTINNNKFVGWYYNDIYLRGDSDTLISDNYCNTAGSSNVAGSVAIAEITTAPTADQITNNHIINFARNNAIASALDLFALGNNVGFDQGVSSTWWIYVPTTSDLTSGTAWTNPYGNLLRLEVSGGTMTSNTLINSMSTGMEDGTFYVGPNDTITLNYSSAPILTWYGF